MAGKNFGQKSPLTNQLSLILNSYSGAQMLNEMLQNADDAMSKEFKVLLDGRTSAYGGKKMRFPKMGEWQGPALYQFDDAVFQQDDLQSISAPGHGTKKGDPTRTGQFGLGFNSVYHLTDLPTFMTGPLYVVFDPHETNLDLEPAGSGWLCNLRDEVQKDASFLTKYADQFEPFKGIFGCDGKGGWKTNSGKGTLFRLPLRTRAQANVSGIKKGPKAAPSFDEVYKEIVAPFLDRVHRRLLFLKSVETIEVYVWLDKESGMRELCKAHVVGPTPSLAEMRQSFVRSLRLKMAEHMPSLTEDKGGVPPDDDGAPPTDPSLLMDESGQPPKMRAYFKAIEKIDVDDAKVLPRPIFKMHIEVSYGHAAELTAGSKLSLSKQESKTQELWVVSAAFGDKKIIEWSKGAPRENLLALLPYAAVAAPVAQRTAKPGAASSISSVPWEPTTRASWKPSDGRVYASLPTRIETHLPVHTDGRWTLAVDRNTFVGDTAGGDGGTRKRDADDAIKAEWNEMLSMNVVSIAYARLIRVLAAGGVERLVDGSMTQCLAPGTESLARVIHALLPPPAVDDRVFKGMCGRVYQLLNAPSDSQWRIFNDDAIIKGLGSSSPGGASLYEQCRVLRPTGNGQLSWQGPSSVLLLDGSMHEADVAEYGELIKPPLPEVVAALSRAGCALVELPTPARAALLSHSSAKLLTVQSCQDWMHGHAADLRTALASIKDPAERRAAVRSLLAFVLQDVSRGSVLASIPCLLTADGALVAPSDGPRIVDLTKTEDDQFNAGAGRTLLEKPSAFVEDDHGDESSCARLLFKHVGLFSQLALFSPVLAVRHTLDASWADKKEGFVVWDGRSPSRAWITKLWGVLNGASPAKQAEWIKELAAQRWPLLPCEDDTLVALDRAAGLVFCQSREKLAAIAKGGTKGGGGSEKHLIGALLKLGLRMFADGPDRFGDAPKALSIRPLGGIAVLETLKAMPAQAALVQNVQTLEPPERLALLRLIASDVDAKRLPLVEEVLAKVPLLPQVNGTCVVLPAKDYRRTEPDVGLDAELTASLAQGSSSSSQLGQLLAKPDQHVKELYTQLNVQPLSELEFLGRYIFIDSVWPTLDEEPRARVLNNLFIHFHLKKHELVNGKPSLALSRSKPFEEVLRETKLFCMRNARASSQGMLQDLMSPSSTAMLWLSASELKDPRVVQHRILYPNLLPPSSPSVVLDNTSSSSSADVPAAKPKGGGFGFGLGRKGAGKATEQPKAAILIPTIEESLVSEEADEAFMSQWDNDWLEWLKLLGMRSSLGLDEMLEAAREVDSEVAKATGGLSPLTLIKARSLTQLLGDVQLRLEKDLSSDSERKKWLDLFGALKIVEPMPLPPAILDAATSSEAVRKQLAEPVRSAYIWGGAKAVPTLVPLKGTVMIPHEDHRALTPAQRETHGAVWSQACVQLLPEVDDFDSGVGLKLPLRMVQALGALPGATSLNRDGLCDLAVRHLQVCAKLPLAVLRAWDAELRQPTARSFDDLGMDRFRMGEEEAGLPSGLKHAYRLLSTSLFTYDSRSPARNPPVPAAAVDGGRFLLMADYQKRLNAGLPSIAFELAFGLVGKAQFKLLQLGRNLKECGEAVRRSLPPSVLVEGSDGGASVLVEVWEVPTLNSRAPMKNLNDLHRLKARNPPIHLGSDRVIGVRINIRRDDPQIAHQILARLSDENFLEDLSDELVDAIRAAEATPRGGGAKGGYGHHHTNSFGVKREDIVALFLAAVPPTSLEESALSMSLNGANVPTPFLRCDQVFGAVDHPAAPFFFNLHSLHRTVCDIADRTSAKQGRGLFAALQVADAPKLSEVQGAMLSIKDAANGSPLDERLIKVLAMPLCDMAVRWIKLDPSLKKGPELYKTFFAPDQRGSMRPTLDLIWDNADWLHVPHERLDLTGELRVAHVELGTLPVYLGARLLSRECVEKLAPNSLQLTSPDSGTESLIRELTDRLEQNLAEPYFQRAVVRAVWGNKEVDLASHNVVANQHVVHAVRFLEELQSCAVEVKVAHFTSMFEVDGHDVTNREYATHTKAFLQPSSDGGHAHYKIYLQKAALPAMMSVDSLTQLNDVYTAVAQQLELAMTACNSGILGVNLTSVIEKLLQVPNEQAAIEKLAAFRFSKPQADLTGLGNVFLSKGEGDVAPLASLEASEYEELAGGSVLYTKGSDLRVGVLVALTVHNGANRCAVATQGEPLTVETFTFETTFKVLNREELTRSLARDANDHAISDDDVSIDISRGGAMPGGLGGGGYVPAAPKAKRPAQDDAHTDFRLRLRRLENMPALTRKLADLQKEIANAEALPNPPRDLIDKGIKLLEEARRAQEKHAAAIGKMKELLRKHNLDLDVDPVSVDRDELIDLDASDFAKLMADALRAVPSEFAREMEQHEVYRRLDDYNKRIEGFQKTRDSREKALEAALAARPTDVAEVTKCVRQARIAGVSAEVCKRAESEVGKRQKVFVSAKRKLSMILAERKQGTVELIKQLSDMESLPLSNLAETLSRAEVQGITTFHYLHFKSSLATAASQAALASRVETQLGALAGDWKGQLRVPCTFRSDGESLKPPDAPGQTWFQQLWYVVGLREGDSPYKELEPWPLLPCEDGTLISPARAFTTFLPVEGAEPPPPALQGALAELGLRLVATWFAATPAAAPAAPLSLKPAPADAATDTDAPPDVSKATEAAPYPSVRALKALGVAPLSGQRLLRMCARDATIKDAVGKALSGEHKRAILALMATPPPAGTAGFTKDELKQLASMPLFPRLDGSFGALDPAAPVAFGDATLRKALDEEGDGEWKAQLLESPAQNQDLDDLYSDVLGKKRATPANKPLTFGAFWVKFKLSPERWTALPAEARRAELSKLHSKAFRQSHDMELVPADGLITGGENKLHPFATVLKQLPLFDDGSGGGRWLKGSELKDPREPLNRLFCADALPPPTTSVAGQATAEAAANSCLPSGNDAAYLSQWDTGMLAWLTELGMQKAMTFAEILRAAKGVDQEVRATNEPLSALTMLKAKRLVELLVKHGPTLSEKMTDTKARNEWLAAFGELRVLAASLPAPLHEAVSAHMEPLCPMLGETLRDSMFLQDPTASDKGVRCYAPALVAFRDAIILPKEDSSMQQSVGGACCTQLCVSDALDEKAPSKAAKLEWRHALAQMGAKSMPPLEAVVDHLMFVAKVAELDAGKKPLLGAALVAAEALIGPMKLRPDLTNTKMTLPTDASTALSAYLALAQGVVDAAQHWEQLLATIRECTEAVSKLLEEGAMKEPTRKVANAEAITRLKTALEAFDGAKVPPTEKADGVTQHGKDMLEEAQQMSDTAEAAKAEATSELKKCMHREYRLNGAIVEAPRPKSLPVSHLTIDKEALGKKLEAAHTLMIDDKQLLKEAEQLHADTAKKLREADAGSACDFWFVSADKLREAGDLEGMPVLQDLMEKRPEWLVLKTIDFSGSCNGDFKKDFLAISHRWEKPGNPDPVGQQMRVIQSFLRGEEGKGFKYVWIDNSSMPQNRQDGTLKKTAWEKDEFGWMLTNVNLLYLGASVLILLDRSYISRFWTQFEAWLAFQEASIRGLNSASEERRRAYIEVVEAGIGIAGDQLKDYLISEWSSVSASDAYNKLNRNDVAVTNQSDKAGQLPKLKKLNDRVVTHMRNATGMSGPEADEKPPTDKASPGNKPKAAAPKLKSEAEWAQEMEKKNKETEKLLKELAELKAMKQAQGGCCTVS